MLHNLLVIIGTGLIPMVMGFIWYHPKVMGTAWMQAAGMTEEKMKGANMAVIFGVSILLSLMLAMSMMGITIHQTHMYSTLQGDLMNPATKDAATEYFTNFMTVYGDRFRTFGHGALHGFLAGLFIALPILGTNALFERKGFKYIAVNVGYWIITLTLMGGVMCKFLKPELFSM